MIESDSPGALRLQTNLSIVVSLSGAVGIAAAGEPTASPDVLDFFPRDMR